MIVCLHLITSLVSTLFFSIFFGLVRSVADIWIPFAIFLGSYLVCTILYFIHLEINHLRVNTKKELDKPDRYAQRIFKYGVEYLDMNGHVKIHVENKELIKDDEKYLFICNHRSSFDPIILLDVYRNKKIAFVSKQENFKIPCCGGIVYAAGCVSLDRSSIREGFKALSRAAKSMNDNNLSMMIYPEGTRNKGEGMLPFKPGALKLAEMANVPIAICVMKNAEMVAKNFPFKRTDVYLKILEVIPAETVKNTNTVLLAKEVEEKMLKAYNEM